MQTKEDFVYDLHISQNIMSMSLRIKLRTFQGTSLLKANVFKEMLLKLIKIDMCPEKHVWNVSGISETIFSSLK